MIDKERSPLFLLIDSKSDARCGGAGTFMSYVYMHPCRLNAM
jgi:hypothetical protein